MKTNVDSPVKTDLGTCASCGTPLLGKHCYACGEKKVDANDYSLRKYLEQSVDIFTHFDTKFFRSFRDLLFVPGKLTVEYLAGRRVKYMKPLQLYVLVSLLFFFFFKNWDLFFTRARYAILEHYVEGERSVPILERDLKGADLALRRAMTSASQKKGVTLERYVAKFDEKMPERSKAFVFLMIPVLGLALYLLYFRKNRFFVPHLIHATHLFSFLLTAATLWLLVYSYVIFPLLGRNNYNYAFVPLGLTLLWYWFASLRRVYGESLGWTTLKTGLMVVALVGTILVYRFTLLWVSYWLG